MDKMGNLGPKHRFYNNTVILRFAGEPQHQYYREDGTKLIPVPSVTTILKIIDKSYYLMPWATKVMGQRILETMPDNEDDPRHTARIGWTKFEELIKKAKSAHREIKEKAGDIGARAHEILEQAIIDAIKHEGRVWYTHIDVQFARKDGKISEDQRVVNCCNAAFCWMENHNVTWIKTESKIYSKAWNYAGTLDGLCWVDSCDDPTCCPVSFTHQRSIADWKSSNQLSIHYLYQTAAYQAAEEEEKGIRIDARWILRLGKEEGDFEAWYATDFANDFEGFKAALRLTNVQKTVEERMKAEKKARTVRRKAAKLENKMRGLE